jgi:hypothetical protein
VNRFQSRRSNGRWQRNTLANTFGLNAIVCREDRLAISAGIMKPPGPWLGEQKRLDADRRARRSAA